MELHAFMNWHEKYSKHRNGYMEILIDYKTLEVLGVHIIGETATELIYLSQAFLS
jgi:pyruvate/2-oxoglutarate dehydrogenase complex dihydrolipoamide dehydrogenase (E3) component